MGQAWLNHVMVLNIYKEKLDELDLTYPLPMSLSVAVSTT